MYKIQAKFHTRCRSFLENTSVSSGICYKVSHLHIFINKVLSPSAIPFEHLHILQKPFSSTKGSPGIPILIIIIFSV